MQASDTAGRLIAATERVICRARDASEITVRAVAGEAGVTLSAISYHFGSFEDLVAATGREVYHRLNTERLNRLKSAVERHAPAPPPVAEVIEALVGPSVRWSLDPRSPYPVFGFIARTTAMSSRPELYRAFAEEVAPHRAFISVLRKSAPWFTEDEIGWRVNAALGVRSQVNRHRFRSRALVGGAFDLDDAETVIARIVEVVEPMFARAPGTPRLSAPHLGRRRTSF